MRREHQSSQLKGHFPYIDTHLHRQFIGGSRLSAEHSIGEGDREEVTSPYLTQCEKLLQAAVRWAGTAIDVGGRPVLADPSVRETLAEIAVGIELARSAPGPMGRIMCSETLIRTASQLLDLVGPAALLVRGADGAPVDGELEFGFRFAPATAIYGGSTDIARNMIAEHVLGLPRSTPRRSTP